MLMAGYSAGLRISEIVALRIRDIDSSRMVIYVRGAKGKKDRQAPLSKILLKQLRKYFPEFTIQQTGFLKGKWRPLFYTRFTGSIPGGKKNLKEQEAGRHT